MAARSPICAHNMRIMNKPTILTLTMIPVCCALAAAGTSPDLAWLQGHWCQQTDEGLVEEFWMAPAHGETVGLARTLSGGKTASFEYTRIVSGEGGLRFIAQPGGVPPTAFAAIPGSTAAQQIAFENPKHDFPQRVSYWREGEALLAEISGPGADGKVMSFQFNYKRCAE